RSAAVERGGLALDRAAGSADPRFLERGGRWLDLSDALLRRPPRARSRLARVRELGGGQRLCPFSRGPAGDRGRIPSGSLLPARGRRDLVPLGRRAAGGRQGELRLATLLTDPGRQLRRGRKRL